MEIGAIVLGREFLGEGSEGVWVELGVLAWGVYVWWGLGRGVGGTRHYCVGLCIFRPGLGRGVGWGWGAPPPVLHFLLS